MVKNKTITGRIIKGVGGLYLVDTSLGVFPCKPLGVFRLHNISPVIGDICSIELNAAGGNGIITKIHERTNELIRPRVANIDQLIVVAAADTVNTYLIDKYLILLEEQLKGKAFGVRILINKVDLPDTTAGLAVKADYESIGYPVVLHSTVTGFGASELSECLSGKVTALAGPSGAGKSSIVNTLSKEPVMAVGELSKKIGRGKHTTRHVELICLDGSSFVMDTPGFASLQFTGITPESLSRYFREFAQYAAGCRFADCRHINEPGCEVKARVGSGITPGRYNNYLSFYNEIEDVRP